MSFPLYDIILHINRKFIKIKLKIKKRIRTQMIHRRATWRNNTIVNSSTVFEEDDYERLAEVKTKKIRNQE
jgi:hypothetical protein